MDTVTTRQAHPAGIQPPQKHRRKNAHLPKHGAQPPDGLGLLQRDVGRRHRARRADEALDDRLDLCQLGGVHDACTWCVWMDGRMGG
jgi:hypothetical protein